MKEKKGWQGKRVNKPVLERDLSSLLFLIMRQYVSNVLPYATLTSWLTRDGSELHKTELCLIGEHGQYMDRHAQVATGGALRDLMTRLGAVRIDVGSQMAGPKKPIRRRVAFDLDAKDYQALLPVKGDAEEKGAETRGVIRTSVWYAIAMSARLLDLFLRERARAEGHEARYRSAIVFSGNRGAHLWLHNSYRDALNDAAIAQFCDEDIPTLTTCDGAHTLYAACPDDLKAALRDYGRDTLTGSVIWERNAPALGQELIPALAALARLDDLPEPEEPGQAFYQRMLNAVGNDLAFWGKAAIILLAPRLDRGVTAGDNHLLKTPFSVHQKSGLLALPVDLSRMDSPAWDLRRILVAPGDRDVATRVQEAVTVFEATF